MNHVDRAVWMVEFVHNRGRVTRAEMLAAFHREFGVDTPLDRQTFATFRKKAFGEIRYVDNGKYWESLRRSPTRARSSP